MVLVPEGLAAPDGNPIARRLFQPPQVITVQTFLVVPIAQWGAFAIHVEASGANFTFRARYLDFNGVTYEDTDPTVDGTAYVAGTRIRFEVPASEHFGEPFLQCGIQSPAGAVNIQNFDIMGLPN